MADEIKELEVPEFKDQDKTPQQNAKDIKLLSSTFRWRLQ